MCCKRKDRRCPDVRMLERGKAILNPPAPFSLSQPGPCIQYTSLGNSDYISLSQRTCLVKTSHGGVFLKQSRRIKPVICDFIFFSPHVNVFIDYMRNENRPWMHQEEQPKPHMMEHDGSRDNKVYQSSFIEQLQYRRRNKLTAVGFFQALPWSVWISAEDYLGLKRPVVHE